MAAIDPDAPWWANLILLAIVALVPTYFAVRAKHEAKKTAVLTEETHVESQDKLDRVLHNVENSHKQGLRDDLDEKVGDLDRKMERVLELVETIASDQRETNADVRGARIDIGHLHNDVGGMRGDIRRNRSRHMALERMVNDIVDQAQEMLDEHHPGTILRAPGPEKDSSG